MTNIFNQMQKNMSPYIVVALPFAVVLMVVSIVLMIEDYNTSRLGYELLPTQKVNTVWMSFAVAFLPQAGQIVFFFIYGRDTNKRWSLAIMFLLFSADIGTDIYFKSSPGGAFNWYLSPIAAMESFLLFTLGSEVLFTLMVGFVLQNLAEFLGVFGDALGTLLNGADIVVAGLIGSSDSDDNDSVTQCKKRQQQRGY